MPDDAEPNPAEGLVALLDLERIEENIFRGRSPHERLARHLPAEHAHWRFGGRHTAEDVLLDAFQVEQRDQVVHCGLSTQARRARSGGTGGLSHGGTLLGLGKAPALLPAHVQYAGAGPASRQA